MAIKTTMLRVIEPATEKVMAELHEATVEEADAAVARAKAAYPAWKAVNPKDRANLMRRIAATVCGKGSLFTAHLTDRELVDFRSLQGFSRMNPVYGELCHQMLANGIVVTPRGIFGCLSTPMTDVELNIFVEALDRSLTALG